MTTVDITLTQGQTFRMQVQWADGSSAPISLAPYRAHMQIRTKAGVAGTPLLDLSSEGDGAELTLEASGQTGAIDVRIPASLTRTLTKNAVYDLFVIRRTDPSEATRLVSGVVTLIKSVTRDDS